MLSLFIPTVLYGDDNTTHSHYSKERSYFLYYSNENWKWKMSVCILKLSLSSSTIFLISFFWFVWLYTPDMFLIGFVIVILIYALYVYENQICSIQHMRETRECGWNKLNKYGNQIEISLVTFPFQGNLRQPFLSPKTFFTTETNYKDLRSRDKTNLHSTRAQGQYKNNLFLSPGCIQSFSLYFLIVYF